MGSGQARATGRLAVATSPRGRTALVVAVVAVVAACVAGSAAAAIRLHSGIGRVSLGMTEQQVRGILGRPDTIRRTRSGVTRILVLDYTMRGTFRVTLRGPSGGLRATTIATRSRRERTPADIGIGSREQALQRAYRGIRCRDVKPRGSRVAIRRECVLGGADRRHTLFTIGRGANPPVVLEVAVVAPPR